MSLTHSDSQHTKYKLLSNTNNLLFIQKLMFIKICLLFSEVLLARDFFHQNGDQGGDFHSWCCTESRNWGLIEGGGRATARGRSCSKIVPSTLFINICIGLPGDCAGNPYCTLWRKIMVMVFIILLNDISVNIMKVCITVAHYVNGCWRNNSVTRSHFPSYKYKTKRI